MKAPLLKVCGMRALDNVRALDELGLDWMGFIFYPKSKRFVGLDFEMPTNIQAKKVGVFVNEEINVVADLVNKCALDFIQLHGDESPEYCEQLGNILEKKSYCQIIKAFGVDEAFDFSDLVNYEIVDCFLFDTKCKDYGGSGKQYDWAILNKYKGPKPFLLSGGISVDSVGILKEFEHNKCLGIDVNSRFELSPAVKDVEKIKRFKEVLYESV